MLKLCSLFGVHFAFVLSLLHTVECLFSYLKYASIMRRPSVKVLEQTESAEEELLMKGPGSFPLERLLAIFQCIVSVAEDPSDEEEQMNDRLGTQGGNAGLMSDVLLQLSSLCNANFIIKGGSCPIEGSTRYRSTISEDLALKVGFLSPLILR